MVYVTGKARIRHAETKEVYEIDSDQIDFQTVGSEERGMGPEITYSAILHHPELGQLVWSLFEYPVGAENDRETDVGPHELITNIDFGLEADAPDDDEDRQARIDALVEWFHERYEDPAQRLPYESQEGGYQWIYGGPYDAREVLQDNFPNEAEDVVEDAVEEIESEGLTEWAPVASPDDYDDSEPLADNDPDTTADEIDALIADIPEAQSYPAFRFGGDGLLHMAAPPDLKEATANDPLLEELRAAAVGLEKSLVGTNAHTNLLAATEHYHAALMEDSISISRLYARGVRLANAAYAAQREIEAENLPPYSYDTVQHLESVLELHRTYIMAQEDGRHLAQGANAYQRAPNETARLRAVAERIADAVNRAPDLFADEVRQHISQITRDIGTGPQPERSNQVAVTTLGNLMSALLKGIGGIGSIGAAIVGGAVVASVPGAAVVAGGIVVINVGWTFLTTNAPSLIALAACVGNDLSWMPSLSYLLERIRRLRGK